MTDHGPRESLRHTIAAARRRILVHTFLHTLVRATLVLLPPAVALVAVDHYWWGGRWSPMAAGAVVAVAVLAAAFVAGRRRGSILHTAVSIDERADLKGRISSAWEFLGDKRRLDSPHQTQVRDAVSHARQIDVRSLFGLALPRYSFLVPVFAALLALSFYVPPRALPPKAEAAVDYHRQRQLSELRQLQDELKDVATDQKDIKEVIEKLRRVEERFDKGEMKDRDVMIELARLDEELAQKMAQLGVDKLEGEVQQVLPHLMASAASRAAASKLKEGKPDEAAEEMRKLAEKMEKGELSDKDKQEMSLNMGVAASKLGKPSKDSLSGDLSKASESLKSNDAKSFESASQSMSDKLKKLGQLKKMQAMQKRISLTKSSLGQGECKECNGQGCSMCSGNGKKDGQGPGKRGEGEGKEGGGKGGLKAGTETAGDPRGERNRLEDSYRNMVKISGMAGNGPVESETETTEGQTSESELDAKELYSEYAEVAEQAIEREDIPLSHRFHVKRYFQAIRPTE